MAEQDPGATGATGPAAESGGQGDEPIPFMQQILDNPFLLLFIGVTMPTVFYILWGVINITSIPLAN